MKRFILINILFLICVGGLFTQGTRRYVTVDSAGAKNSTDWSNACDTTQLQTAINETGVKEVWVARGTYKQSVEVGGSGNRYKTFKIKNGLAIYGGFTRTETSTVSLKIFDALGREVATLISKELNIGRYSTNWNAKGLSSGVYFYQLRAGSFVETKKLVLLR